MAAISTDTNGTNMILKHGVSIKGCEGEILEAAITVIDPIFHFYGKEGVITSGTEKHKHSAKRSAHYRGDALDWRSHWFTLQQKTDILESLKNALGPNFVVVLENIGKSSEHYHIHWSPVYED